MTTINPTGAATRMLNTGTDTGDDCLTVVSEAIYGYAGLHHIGPALPTARAAWDAAQGHTENTPAPRDYPVFFSGAAGDYDVCISLGDGTVAAIDTLNGVYHHGTIGIQTLAEREHQIGGSYLGWATEFCGYTLEVPTAPAAPPADSDPDGRTIVRFVRYPTGTIAGVYSDGSIVGFPTLAAYQEAGSPKFTQL